MNDNSDFVPLISVIMPVYNGVETVDRAISSLLRQTFSGWELIAVDDGSTDGSYERLRIWGEKDCRIHAFRSDVNRGPSSARNEAIKHSAGEMVAYLDCDDEFYSDYLEHVARLCDQANVLFFGFDCILDGDEPSQPRIWDPIPYSHLFFESNLSTPLGVAHRHNLWARVGGFDESVWIQEDWDFWKRLARTGTEILFVPLRSGLYRFRKGSLSHSPRTTSTQSAIYETNRAAGGSLYQNSNRPLLRPETRKIAFAAPYSYLAPCHPVSRIAADTLETLARSGFTCQAFCGAGPTGTDIDEVERTLDRLGLPHMSRDLICGPYAARLTFTRKRNVSVTLVQPKPIGRRDPQAETAESFLAFYQKFLETYEPDALLTYCNNPWLDPMIRLAKRRDIPIVVPLLSDSYHDRMAFFKVDYCLVTSEDVSRRYWESLGLACVTLPPISDPDHAPTAYAEFFRTIRPQPGPPIIPK